MSPSSPANAELPHASAILPPLFAPPTAPPTAPPPAPPSPPPPIDSLPDELWLRIVEYIDDHDRCFTWFIVRRASQRFRRIAEDVFANRVIRKNSSISFTGEYARNIFKEMWSFNDCYGFVGFGNYSPYPARFKLEHAPAILFKPAYFDPPTTKDRLIAKVQDEPADYERKIGPTVGNAHIVLAPRNRKKSGKENLGRPDLIPLSWPLFLRRQCCTCPHIIQTVADVARCNCLADIIFSTSVQSKADSVRLINGSHFVRLNNQLKIMKIPSLVVNTTLQELSFDWRLLCQRFFHDELMLRRTARPWMRYLSVRGSSKLLLTHSMKAIPYHNYYRGCPYEDLLQACREDGWIFWNDRVADAEFDMLAYLAWKQ